MLLIDNVYTDSNINSVHNLLAACDMLGILPRPEDGAR